GDGRLSGIVFVQKFNGGGDFECRTISLNAAGREKNFEARISSLNDVQNVANGWASRRSDQSDALWKKRQRAVPFFGKETFGIQLLFESLEGCLKRARSLQFRLSDAQLILSARFINSEFSTECDLPAILQECAIHEQLTAKKHAAQLRVGIFERE